MYAVLGLGVLAFVCIAGLWEYLKENFNFWDWMNHDYERGGERFGSVKRITAAVLVFIVTPLVLYQLVTWDPVIGETDDGDPVKLGIWIILGVYWLGAHFLYKADKANKRLNSLLDSLLAEDKEEADEYFASLRRQRKSILQSGNSAEDRAKVLGLK